jgi:PTH1 family peptidyl-tRNA hydrolase
MVEQRLYLIVGLGNPGQGYELTRHNAGFMVVDRLAEAHDIPIQRQKFNVLFNRGRIAEREVVIAKPCF